MGMLRQVITSNRVYSHHVWSFLSRRGFASHPPVDEEQQAAREWFTHYKAHKISPQICTVTFSRSSGPGGQKVNKTSSKAMLRLAVADIVPPPPRLVLDQLSQSRYSSDKGQAIVIQADTSRKQGDNKEDCFSKLDDLITTCCSNVIKKDASPEQLKKVEKLYSILCYHGYHRSNVFSDKLQAIKNAS